MSGVPQQARAVGAAGGRYLLTCAMRRYEHSPEWDREELRADVQRVVALLCGDFLPVDGRYLHVDVLGDSPTSVELLDRLRSFCKSPDRRSDDYIVLYLTGHGEIPEDGDHILLTADTDPSDLLHRSVRTADLVRLALADTRVRRLLLLLDTCYSGHGAEVVTREALRRIEQPAASDHDHGGAGSGRGVIVVAATRPYEQALPGAFTGGLDRAARSLASAGNAVPTLRVGALINGIKADALKPPSQSCVWHAVGMDADEPAFLLNPRYSRSLVDLDLLEQERARSGEQRAGNLRQRFLPATRWFTGRHAALADLAGWLNDAGGDWLPRVVSGQAGSGKTAVLGLLAALSDVDQAPTIPRDGLPVGLNVADSAIGDAVHAGTMTTDQVRDRIAAAAGLRVDSTQDLVQGLQHVDNPLTVLVDALDESVDPHGLITGLLNPLISHCAGHVRFLLGTRPHLLTPNLLGTPDSGRYVPVDLDSEAYADPSSIRAYVRRILLAQDSLDSAYRPSGVYRVISAEVLDAVTAAIGDAAGPSFLVARIAATTEATVGKPPSPKDPSWLASLPRRAGEAMRRDLRVRLGASANKAASLLLPLAYAQGGGLPWEDIWSRLADVLSPGHGYRDDDLFWLRRAAGSYAVEGVADGRSVYRLYHRALAEHLLEDRDQQADELAITNTFISLVPAGPGGVRDWAGAHPYIRTHLATHAARAASIDPLLADPGYLLASGRAQLLVGAATASSPPARAAADVYRHSSHHLRTKPPTEHASYLQLAARRRRAADLADALDPFRPDGTWSTRWASWRLQSPHHTLTGHADAVLSVAVGELDRRPVVVSAGGATVRVSDLATGAQVGAPFTGHTREVASLAVAELDGRPVVVSGGWDDTVRLSDLATGAAVGDPFTGHTGVVSTLAMAELDGRPIVVSGSHDGSVRVWDLANRTPVGAPFTGHTSWVTTLAVTELDGRAVVVSGDRDGTLRVWDLADGTPIGAPFTGHTSWVTAAAVAELDGRPVLVSCGTDGIAAAWEVWDLATGAPVGGPFPGRVESVVVSELDGRPVVVAGGRDGTVRVWDLATGAAVSDPFTGHTGVVTSVVVAELDREPVVVSGGRDGTVRVWDLATRAGVSDPFTGHRDEVTTLALAELDGRPVVVSGSEDGTVRVWDLATGTPVGAPFTGHTSWVTSVAVAELDGRPVVVSGGQDGTVRVWDLATGAPVGDPFPGPAQSIVVAHLHHRPVVVAAGGATVRVWDLATRAAVGTPFTGHTERVATVAVADLDDLPVVVSGCWDGTVRVSDLATGAPVGTPFTGHTSLVHSVAVGELHGHPVVVSGGNDRTVRVSDLATGAPVGAPFTGHTDVVTSVAVAELNGRPVVVSGGMDRMVRVWDLATRSPVGNPFTGHTDWVSSVVVARLGGRPVVVSGGRDRTVRAWDLATRAPIGDPFTGHTDVVTSVAVAELNGRPVVVSGGTDRTVRVWDLAIGAPVGAPFTGHTTGVTSVAVADLDGRLVVVSAGSAAVRVSDLATGAPVGAPFTGHMGEVTSVAMAELGGRPVVASGGGATLRVWDLATRAPVDNWLTRRALRWTKSLTVAELDRRPMLIHGRDSIRGDQSVLLWDLTRRRAIRRLLRRVRLRHSGPVLTTLPNPHKGSFSIVTGSAGGVLRFWDVATRTDVTTAISGSGPISAGAPLGSQHVVIGAGDTVFLYRYPSPMNAAPIVKIQLDSPIRSLATRHPATVVAATDHGLIVLDVPH